jgi:predicted RNA methylase
MEEVPMIGRLLCGACLVAFGASVAGAQDVPGIEICTVEKTMERRTSCLQSNVEFLQKTIAKQALDHQQKMDAAVRQIEALKVNVVTLQKAVDDLKAAQAKAPDSARKADTSPPKDAAAKDTAKDTTKDTTKDGAKDAPKEGSK